MPWWKVLLGGIVLLVLVTGIRYMVDQGGTKEIINKVPSVNINP